MCATNNIVLLVFTNVLWISGIHCANWSDWTEWSECSRTCDGGASYQLRYCNIPGYCSEDSIRYKTCNNEPCPPGSGDFRQEQCASYNDVPYKGQPYEWLPYYEVSDPCSLRCQAKGQGFEVELAPQVLDGTRCDKHSTNMCINGRCLTVGCDHVLSSNKKLDNCGVCGGDNSSCSPLRYVWKESDFSECSVTCGIGVQMTSISCKDTKTGETVASHYCKGQARPIKRGTTCQKPECSKPVWISSRWSPCSKSCGGGITQRSIYCVEVHRDGGFQRTRDELCTDPKLERSKRCNEFDCPRWYAGEWSPCSVTCESGFQYREVICRRTKQQGCSLQDQPVKKRVCETAVHCMGEKAPFGDNTTKNLRKGTSTLEKSQHSYEHLPVDSTDGEESREREEDEKDDANAEEEEEGEGEMEGEMKGEMEGEMEGEIEVDVGENQDGEAHKEEKDEEAEMKMSKEEKDEEIEAEEEDEDEDSDFRSNETRDPEQTSQEHLKSSRENSVEISHPLDIRPDLPPKSTEGFFPEMEIEFNPLPLPGKPKQSRQSWEENSVYDYRSSSDNNRLGSNYETNAIKEYPIPFDPYLKEHEKYLKEIGLNGVKVYNPAIDDPRIDIRGNKAESLGEVPENPGPLRPELVGVNRDDIDGGESDDISDEELEGTDVRPGGADDVRLEGGDVRPGGAVNVRPEDADDVRPRDSDVRPGDGDVRPGDGDVRPGDGDVRPGGSDVRPGDTDGEQTDGEDKLTVEYEALDGTKHQISTTPGFVVTSWEECTKTCGQGVQRRQVDCKVFHEFTRQIQDLPDWRCPGVRPPESQPCMIRECGGPNEGLKPPFDNYYWNSSGYSTCSATCLGGFKEPQFHCIRERDKATVNSQFCSSIILPQKEPEVCNDAPCPPEWQTGEFGPCSAQCGGGYQRRKVQCIKKLSRRDGDYSGLQDADCKFLFMPPRTLACNMGDCPPKWVTPDWSDCSVTCGTGYQTRQVLCQQIVAGGISVITRPPHMCTAPQPPSERYCYNHACPTQAPLEQSRIDIDPSTYVQTKRRKNIVLNVGGKATLITKTSISVRCAVRHYRRERIEWREGGPNGTVIPERGRVKVTPKGMLRLRKTKPNDKGKYTCIAGSHTANIEINFHSSHDAHNLFEERKHQIEYNFDFIQNVHTLQAQKRKDEITLSLLLGPLRQSQIPFHFKEGEWGVCSKSCGGGAGLQHRDITCEVVMENYFLVVDDKYCLQDDTNMKPLETRDCGFHKCPTWEVGQWSRCTDSTCMSPGQGAHKRPLYCIANNGTTVSHEHCDVGAKPPNKKPCVHSGCLATWRASNWTKCSKTCRQLAGDLQEGVQTRSLNCIWVSNKKSAGVHCRHLAKPETVKPCITPLCVITACRDKSKFCSLIPHLNMCHMGDYRRQCCYSCKQGDVEQKLRHL